MANMAPGTATDPYELRFDTGRICLDLVATTHPVERLDSVPVLRAWITGAGLVPPGTPLAHADAAWLAEFRELRGETARLVRSRPTPRTTPYDLALVRVNDLARAAPPAPRAVPGRDGTLVRELSGPPSCAALLGALARVADEQPVAYAFDVNRLCHALLAAIHYTSPIPGFCLYC